MFETVELGREISKQEFKERSTKLRQDLLDAQREMRRLGIPTVVVFGGVDGAGKSETTGRLLEWMDARWVKTRAYDVPSDEESQRPDFWRYWRDLPAAGTMGVFLSAWYSRPFVDFVYNQDEGAFYEALTVISTFERMIADDGALVIKFWMHIPSDTLERTLKRLANDELQSWRVTKKDWDNLKRFDDFVNAAEHLIMRTSTGRSPWHLIEGADGNYRELKVGNLLLDAMRRAIEEKEKQLLAQEVWEEELERKNGDAKKKKKKKKDKDNSPAGSSSRLSDSELIVPGPHSTTILDKMDLSAKLGRDEYDERLEAAQARFGHLALKARQQNRSVVCAFEGVDAGGKGGAIRRLTSPLNPKFYQVIPIAAPTDEEFAHHYLWRFWRHLPRDGRVTVFDRTWYGRVLVERVEGFASKAEWRRAYNEINYFESELCRHGTVLIKYWMHISQDEQLARFNARAETPHKQWKLTDEDWRNREKWPLYKNAVHDMVERTSTAVAPWHLVSAEQKRFARVSVIETACRVLEDHLS